jgi:hypothetical protein
MFYLRIIVKIGYWIIVACIPASIFLFEREYTAAIGCPTSGDCYVPGSEHLLYIDMLFMFSAVVLWPLVLWKIGGYAWSMLRGTSKD